MSFFCNNVITQSNYGFSRKVAIWSLFASFFQIALETMLLTVLTVGIKLCIHENVNINSNFARFRKLDNIINAVSLREIFMGIYNGWQKAGGSISIKDCVSRTN